MTQNVTMVHYIELPSAEYLRTNVGLFAVYVKSIPYVLDLNGIQLEAKW